MYIFSITRLLSKFPVSRFPGFRKPGNLQKCLKTQKLNGHLPDAYSYLQVSWEIPEFADVNACHSATSNSSPTDGVKGI